MKSTLDTNIFLYATISRSCAEKIDETYQKNQFNIILRSVNEETRPKLIELASFFSIFLDQLGKSKNPLKQIDSEFYEVFKKKYPQIFTAVRNYIVKHNISNQKTANELYRIIGEIRVSIKAFIQITNKQRFQYPTTETDYKKVVQSSEFSKWMKKLLSTIKNNDNDRKHMALCACFLNQYKDQLSFYTLDEQDFLKNKSELESQIKNLVIETVNVNVENIVI